MIKTVIFDIGHVLVGYDWHSFVRNIAGTREREDRLCDALFCHGIWPELDRGIWPEKKILQGFIDAAPDMEPEILQCFYHVGDALWQHPFAKDWIRSLKDRGLQVLYLSNWSYHLLAQNPGLVDFTALMDGGIFSCDVKLIKPDHAIYEELIRRYHLIPEECVFLDDKEENIQAARECGLKGIIAVDHEKTVSELEEMLDRENGNERDEV